MISHNFTIDVGTTIDAPVGGVLITLRTLDLEHENIVGHSTYPPNVKVAMTEPGGTPKHGELQVGDAMRFDTQGGVQLELRFMRPENSRLAHFRLTELTS